MPHRPHLLVLFGLAISILVLGAVLIQAISPRTVLARGARSAPQLAPKVVRTATALQAAYSSSDWTGVSRLFKNKQLGADVIHLLKDWHSEGVSPLRVDVVYTQAIAAHYDVGTVRFSSDARTMPSYFIWIFDVSATQGLVTQSTTGITGVDFVRASWQVSRSAHFVVYHSPYQLQGADRAGLADLEYQRTQFIKKFGVQVAPVSHYYLFPDRSLMSRLTQKTCGRLPDNIGCASPFSRPPSIQASVWPTLHEPIHIYERALEPPPRGNLAYVAPLFIAEGMAVALEERSLDPRLSDYCSDLRFAPLNDCAHIAINHVKPINLLPDSGFNRAEPGYAYSLGGSFVSYLIEHYGYRSFGHFYYTLAAQPKDRISDYNVATRAVYRTDIASLLKRWTSDLCRNGCF